MAMGTMGAAAAAIVLVAHSLMQSIRHAPENMCRMTYMMPNYYTIPVPHASWETKLSYSLLLYREGSQPFHKRGIPVLFIPGNAGSGKQVRSMASEAAREHVRNSSRGHLDFWAVDFEDELSALSGDLLLSQTKFVCRCIPYILESYKERGMEPGGIVLVAHSMGGHIARIVAGSFCEEEVDVAAVLSLASPQTGLPVVTDPLLQRLIDTGAELWRQHFFPSPSHGDAAGWSSLSSSTPSKRSQRWGSFNTPLVRISRHCSSLNEIASVSVGGGLRDLLVGTERCDLSRICPPTHCLSVSSTAVAGVWMPIDHQAILWCNQMVETLVSALYSLVDEMRLVAMVMEIETGMMVKRLRTLGLLTFLKDWRLVYLEEDAASATCQQALESGSSLPLYVDLKPQAVKMEKTSCIRQANSDCLSREDPEGINAGAAALPPFTLPGSTDPLPASLTIEKLRCRARDGKEEAGAGGEDLKETFSPVVLVTPVSSWRTGLSEGFARVVSSHKEKVNVWMHQSIGPWQRREKPHVFAVTDPHCDYQVKLSVDLSSSFGLFLLRHVHRILVLSASLVVSKDQGFSLARLSLWKEEVVSYKERGAAGAMASMLKGSFRALSYPFWPMLLLLLLLLSSPSILCVFSLRGSSSPDLLWTCTIGGATVDSDQNLSIDNWSHREPVLFVALLVLAASGFLSILLLLHLLFLAINRVRLEHLDSSQRDWAMSRSLFVIVHLLLSTVCRCPSFIAQVQSSIYLAPLGPHRIWSMWKDRALAPFHSALYFESLMDKVSSSSLPSSHLLSAS
ncbi:hypothetical protein GUITHDRAFT_140667 [Guillardia theta CCMP2712]|uniref:GPI inositol-deacylase n=1 Tax=Guillardia theta (strain CCMP2712) TaxID=905079 RepID=L1J4M1_GUITC|nr:hypothetical protein GUITHDRAFT_140667 [Guillardia theta CCMP2712]EKX43074.1 hypothetical protein GUITHDRAFT_140667 [Guillardia theta CCMP2712]|eukprot:XP_005830054.1 hypothetical protein GUITHDRAFT_140667 [Guillardia theta CCMP2712]